MSTEVSLRPLAGGDHWRDLRGRQTQSPSPSPTRPQETCHLSRLRVIIQRGPFDEVACRAVSWQKRGWGVSFGAPTDPRTQIRGISWGSWLSCKRQKGVQSVVRGLCGELRSLVGVERLPAWHARLVGGVGGHPSCRWPPQTCPEGMSFFWNPLGEVQGPQSLQWLFFTTHPKMHQ